MTPMDFNPAMMPTSNAGSVQAVSGKSGEDDTGDSGGEFNDAMKTVARDKQDKGHASQKSSGVGKSKEAMLERLRRLEAERLAARDENSTAHAGTKVEEAKTGEEVVAVEKTESDEEIADDVVTVPRAEPGEAEKALALILAHTTPKDNEPHKTSLRHEQDDVKASVASAVEADADVAAAKPLRDVKIGSVKVETHFAPMATPAIAASLAQKIANAGQVGATVAPVQQGSPNAGTPRANATDDRVSSLKDLDALQAAAGVRDQPVEGGGVDRQGGQRSGRGDGSGADAKAAAVVAERKPVASASPDTLGAAGQGATPAQQLGQRMVAVAHELKAENAAPVAQSTTDAASNSAPVRVLSINLHPEDLGSVTVRMTLVRDALEVQIEAEHPSTARMLQSDSDALSDMLRSSGIQLDGVTVRAASSDSVSGSTGSSQSMLDAQSQGGAQPDSRTAGGNGGRQDRQQGFGERASGRGGYEDDTSQRAAAGGLYI